jgi:hypothetical protein
VVAGLLLVALGTSSRRLTGDGQEYLLMAERLATGHAPTVSIEAAQQAGVYDAKLVSRHGRQEMWHFWFFPLMVAPFLAITRAVGGPPVLAFGIVNAILLGVGIRIVFRRAGLLAALLLGLSPIVWWVDKPQVEVFTFVWLLLGCALLPSFAWAALCFAIAATQNPPIGGLVVLVAGIAAWQRRARMGALWPWGLAVAILGLHPAYYWYQLGRLTPLVESHDLRLPAWRTLLTPLLDLNLGLLVNAPLLLLVIGGALVLACGRREDRGRAGFVLAASGLFLVAFTQAPNVNSGGTPGMTRYALWLLPPAVLILARLPRQGWRGALAGGLTAASVVWSLWWFRPTLPERYLEPTRVALYVWSNYPAVENPLPEIFAERLRHQDGVNTLASTPNCAKALIQSGVWPDPCEPVGTLPPDCRAKEALCYGNRRPDGSYAFVPTSRRGGINLWELWH